MMAAIGRGEGAVYGLGITEEAAVADARRQARDVEATFEVVPITRGAARFVLEHGGAPDRRLIVTPRLVRLAREGR